MLYETFMEPCRRLTRTRVPDGEGGWIDEWQPGKKFDAAIVTASTSQPEVADARTAHSACTVTSLEPLAFHDVFERLSDGKTFRVLGDSDDGMTPDAASFSFGQVPAEGWEVPR